MKVNGIYFNFPVTLSIVTLRIIFVSYSPIQFTNTANDVLYCEAQAGFA